MSTLTKEPEVVLRNGKPVAVIIPIRDYEALLERLEDAEDIAYLRKSRAKPQAFRPLKEYLAEHGPGGI